MIINERKTKIMMVSSRNAAFEPRVQLNNNDIEVVEENKILGITTDRSQKMNGHVDQACAKIKSSLR